MYPRKKDEKKGKDKVRGCKRYGLKERGKIMKKLLAMSMAAMMMMGMATTGIHAAEAEGTKDVSTDGETSTPSGEVYGRISKDALKQMKFTVPIRIDFAVVKGDTDNNHSVSIGDYKIVVPNDSETNVKLTNVKIERANSTKWDLKTKEDVAKSANIHDIALQFGGTRTTVGDKVTVAAGTQELAYGDNAIADFIVDKNTNKSLNITGESPKVEITESEEAKLAFNVVYTITQTTESAPAPAPVQ